MKQVDVLIMGQSYRLSCPQDGEDTLLNAAKHVDQAMCNIRDAGHVKARDMIAVLACLNFSFELASLQTQTGAAGTAPNSSSLPDLRPDQTGAAIGLGDTAQDKLRHLIARMDDVLGDARGDARDDSDVLI